MNTLEALKRIMALYPIEGEVSSFQVIPTGHINETFLVEMTCGGTKTLYVAQKINAYVFKEPEKVMANIKTVSDYLEENNIHEECGIRHYLNTKDGKNYLVEDGFYWRICDYIDNSVSYDTVESLEVLKNAGFAFGRFQAMLADIPMDKLYDTIPDFHNTRTRMNNLFASYRRNEAGRREEVAEEMAFFTEHRALCSRLVELLEEGKLPLRVTHNDTKYNNILMDKATGKPLCVIDLDTIMPGLTMYDFGDAIRFAANTAAEDETDLSKVSLNMEYFRVFTEGFLKAMGDSLTETELDNLALGAFIITAEIGSRFLADYLDGDKYFKIHRPKHNLERARCQIQLARDILTKLEEMKAIVRSFSK